MLDTVDTDAGGAPAGHGAARPWLCLHPLGGQRQRLHPVVEGEGLLDRYYGYV